MIYRIRRNIDSDFNLAIWQSCKDHQTNLRHPFILQAWVSLRTVLKIANLKSCQRLLSKMPNIMFANNSAYTVNQCVCGGSNRRATLPGTW